MRSHEGSNHCSGACNDKEASLATLRKKGQDIRYFLETLSITNKLNVMQKAFNNISHDNGGGRTIGYFIIGWIS